MDRGEIESPIHWGVEALSRGLEGGRLAWSPKRRSFTVGTFLGAMLCAALAPKFPYGLVVNPPGLAIAWGIALLLALSFGMYPAVRASRLSPMEVMQ